MGNLKHTIKTAAVSSVITASAVLSVCGIVLGSSADAQNLFNTDVNGDGKTDIMDLNIVKNVVLNNENNGAAVTESEDSDRIASYTAVLDYYYQAYNDPIELSEFGSNWLTPRISENKAENFEKTGYAFRDLNGDGTPELIIGEIEDTKDNTGSIPGVVYSYSKEKNEIIAVFESWNRNRNILLSDNSIVNFGSNGVSSSVLGHFVLESGTCSKNTSHLYFQNLKVIRLFTIQIQQVNMILKSQKQSKTMILKRLLMNYLHQREKSNLNLFQNIRSPNLLMQHLSVMKLKLLHRSDFLRIQAEIQYLQQLKTYTLLYYMI